MSTSPETVGGSPPQLPAAGNAPGDVSASPAAVTVLAPPAPLGAPIPTCANCGAATPGKFCGNCGQRRQSPVHSAWHFLSEATEDLTHADSRLWRTLLSLLLKPGFLTREFVDGRRASYLPPVRLYLVLSAVFFLIATWSPAPVVLVGTQQSDSGGSTKLVVSSLQRESSSRPGESAAARQARICGRIEYHGWGSSRLEPAMRKACIQSLADNGLSLRESFFHALPRAMFVFLPLLAAVMTLLYWRPRHYYVEQLLLLVHNHAFVFLVAIISWMLQQALRASLSASWPVVILRLAIQVYIAVYMYLSLRRFYAQGTGLTVAKFLVMSGAYLVSALGMVALTTVYSLLAL